MNEYQSSGRGSRSNRYRPQIVDTELIGGVLKHVWAQMPYKIAPPAPLQWDLLGQEDLDSLWIFSEKVDVAWGNPQPPGDKVFYKYNVTGRIWFTNQLFGDPDPGNPKSIWYRKATTPMSRELPLGSMDEQSFHFMVQPLVDYLNQKRIDAGVPVLEWSRALHLAAQHTCVYTHDTYDADPNVQNPPSFTANPALGDGDLMLTAAHFGLTGVTFNAIGWFHPYYYPKFPPAFVNMTIQQRPGMVVSSGIPPTNPNWPPEHVFNRWLEPDKTKVGFGWFNKVMVFIVTDGTETTENDQDSEVRYSTYS